MNLRTRTIAIITLLALLPCAPGRAVEACGEPASVCDTSVPGALRLVAAGQIAPVFTDGSDHAGVQRAARDLQHDLAAVAGHPASRSAEVAVHHASGAILVGTLGHSPRIDRIVREQSLDVSDVRGRWEAFLLQVVENPEPGVERALLIVGSDKRGTIFGIYELSRRLGVSPWRWWADVPVAVRSTLHVSPGRFVDAPAVKYRGIFLNDEEPALGNWARTTFGGFNKDFYARVFELILRLKGNHLWPAMWGKAIADDDPRTPALADEYGIVIGTTHHEPMMRAHVEWQRHGSGPWDYDRNRDTLRGFWRSGIERMAGNESVVTLGMRGDGDEAMREDTAITLLERIVADQRAILADVTGRPPQATPQIWALYKEVQDYFDQGMQVPDDVTLLFADDNWGNIRRLPARGEQRAGGYGIYYHFDYVGGPRNYKWVNTTQIERVWEQMQLAYAHGADRLWMVNVGDLKPMELPISFFLDLAWNPGAFPLERLTGYPAAWAAEQFGAVQSAAIGELLTRYTQFNARRKPELLSAETYSLIHHREAERVLADWQALEERTLAISRTLSPAQRDAWVQLVEYPILASANLNQLYLAVARNRLHAAQGRASTNAWAREARRLFARDAELARVYERDIAGGKWIHMMSQPRIGYTHWQQPERDVMPALVQVDVPAAGVMGVALEGDARAWPRPAERGALPPLESFGAQSRELVVFNRGAAAFTFEARASRAWLRALPARGDVTDERRVQLEVDWNEVPIGNHLVELYLRGSDGTEVHLDVPVQRPANAEEMTGFIETDDGIAIEAEHHARAVAAPGLAWTTIPHLGRTLSAVTAWPATAPAQRPGKDGMRLEYPLWLQRDGEVDVRVVLSPTLDTRHRGGLRFAVSIDDEPPQTVTVGLDPTPGHRDFMAWSRAVSDSVAIATTRHRVRQGAQLLKLWMIDPGVVFQRVEIVRGGHRPSYLGAEESKRR